MSIEHWGVQLSHRDAALFKDLPEPEAERFAAYLFSVPKKPDGSPTGVPILLGSYGNWRHTVFADIPTSIVAGAAISTSSQGA